MNHSNMQVSNHMSHDKHHSNILPNRSVLKTCRHSDRNTNNHHSTMKMYFHSSFTETILFEQWSTTSIPLFIGSCIFVFILGILYEGIREFRQCLEDERLNQRPIILDNQNETELERMNIKSTESSIEAKKKIPLKYGQRTLQAVLYTIQLALGYILMLIAMTFNVYLFFAIIFGVGIGHLIYTLSRKKPIISKN